MISSECKYGIIITTPLIDFCFPKSLLFFHETWGRNYILFSIKEQVVFLGFIFKSAAWNKILFPLWKWNGEWWLDSLDCIEEPTLIYSVAEMRWNNGVGFLVFDYIENIH